MARRTLLSLLERLPEGRLTIIEGQQRMTFGRGDPRATVEVLSARLWPMLLHGSRGLAEAYTDGHWTSPDLTAVVRVAARNASVLDLWRRRVAPARTALQVARGLRARNTRARSRRSIAAHYDLGNEFFALMLDETMTYSCAYFSRREMTLGQASTAKLELVCRQLELQSDDDVLEIGSGWGAFAVYAAKTRGCRVTTTTISREQYEYARAQAQAAGVADLVTVLCEDYRDLRGSYDKLVSIEMIEAVGWRDFGTFFARCSNLLAADGSLLLQAIVIDDRAYAVERTSRSFIRTHIFPDGCLPSLEVIARCVARHADLRITSLKDLTPHYAETLRRWRANFEAAHARAEELGYDERFRRMWRMYLAYCEAGFEERRIGVVQMHLAKPRWRERAGFMQPEVIASAPESRASAAPSPLGRSVSAGRT
ncbi:MAG TPA: cyclopropane-fatty-acyl-phospholipid synthase family protein [Solirubrobacteraceae bacterium]|nr:cyclopropane-fatty-acyl-phospholipid synthase family protein [Solirubrobacteraceae bacterium]